MPKTHKLECNLKWFAQLFAAFDSTR